MSWTCACNTQNLDRTRYCEFCGKEHTPAKREATGSGVAWSPPTPPVRLEPWASGPRWQISDLVRRELDALKAKLAPSKVDNELERRYLEAVKRKKAAQA